VNTFNIYIIHYCVVGRISCVKSYAFILTNLERLKSQGCRWVAYTERFICLTMFVDFQQIFRDISISASWVNTNSRTKSPDSNNFIWRFCHVTFEFGRD